MSLQTLSENEKRTLITRYDPTRTTTLRNQFARNMRGRFDRICAKINKAIIEQDCFGMLSTYQDIPPRRAYDFPRSQDKIAEFLNWLQEQIDNDILEVIPGAQLGQAIERAWTNKFIQSAFQKGIYMARQELKRAGYPIPDNLPEIDVIFNSPFYLERVGLVFTRTYTDLKGITDAMASQISRVLAQGMAEGRNPREIARMLTKTITGPSGDLGLTDILGRFIPAKRRAEMLARTEIIRAHHLAKVQEYRNWGAIDVQVKAEWITAGYNVCPECASLEGQVFDLDEVEGMLPKHPNCFISWLVPVYTPDGWVKIGNIKVGDKVLTHKGRFRKVTEVIRIPNQRPSVVELNIKDIGKVEVTEDHPILVITKEGNKEWKPAKDITTDDQVLKLTIIDSNYGFIPQSILNVRKYIPHRDRILHNLSVEEDESYVAKGIVVHNCRCTIVPVETEKGGD